MQGDLPGGTYKHPPFPAVRHLNLANNSLSGELPDALRYSGPFRLVTSPLIDTPSSMHTTLAVERTRAKTIK